MADPARTPERPHTRPAWIKVLGIVALVIIAGVVVMALSGGNHGPGQHLPGGGDEAPAEHTPPPGGHD